MENSSLQRKTLFYGQMKNVAVAPSSLPPSHFLYPFSVARHDKGEKEEVMILTQGKQSAAEGKGDCVESPAQKTTSANFFWPRKAKKENRRGRNLIFSVFGSRHLTFFRSSSGATRGRRKEGESRGKGGSVGRSPFSFSMALMELCTEVGGGK